MFQHFNYWYATMAVSVIIAFWGGYTNRDISTGAVRSTKLTKLDSKALAIATLSVFGLAILESYRGFFALAEKCFDGPNVDIDGLEISFAAMMLMAVFAIATYYLLWWTCIFGKWCRMRKVLRQEQIQDAEAVLEATECPCEPMSPSEFDFVVIPGQLKRWSWKDVAFGDSVTIEVCALARNGGGAYLLPSEQADKLERLMPRECISDPAADE